MENSLNTLLTDNNVSEEADKDIFISMIICTFNRPEKLRECLLCLLKQETFEKDFEIIVVDNNPSGTNKQIIDSINSANKKRIKYLWEERRGKGFALNKGINSADGDIIAFIDEDNMATQDYLRNIYREFAKDESLFVLVGRILLPNPDYLPLTTKEFQQRQEFRYPWTPWSVGHGSNLSVKKEVFQKIGVFDVSFGPGTFTGSAEDTDMVFRILRSGYRIIYSPDVINYHDHGRVREADVENIRYNYAKGRGAFYTKYVLLRDKYAFRMVFWELRSLWRRYYRNVRDHNKKGQLGNLRILRGVFLGAMYRILVSIFRYRRNECANV